MSEADDQDRTLPQGTPPRPVPPRKPASSGADDLDLTVPQGKTPRPVPAGRRETGAGAGSHAAGADPTQLQGSDATVLQGSDATHVPDHDDPSARKQTTTTEATKVFADRFEVIDLIGEGGMGRVFRVRDRQIAGREIALKVLRPRYSRNETFRDLFFKEIHASQGFVAEQVVQVRDTGQMKDGTLFLTMDLVDGDPLDEVLERESSLAARHALEVARQTLLGLASGHEHGFVHRDVKPSNVILAHKIAKTEDNPYGVGVRLLDFGIAGVAAEVEEGVVVGTPRYMSPEQVQGQRLDARSDLFAVGVLLYEMLTGERPFEGDTIQAVQTSVLETDVAPLISDLEGLPEPVRKILHKALQKDREKRFQSAAEFIEAIEKSKAFHAPSGVPKWVAALLALFIFASVAEAALLLMQQRNLAELQLAAGQAGLGSADFSERLAAQKRDQEETYSRALKALEDERDQAVADLAQFREEAKRNEGDELAKLSADVKSLQRDYEQRDQEYRDLKAKYDKLEEDAEQFKTKLTPERKAVDLFDTLLDRISEGSGASALTHLEAQEKSRDTYIAPGQGREYVWHLVTAAAELESAGKLLPGLIAPGSNADARQSALQELASAKRSLARAEETAKAFRIESEGWIGEENPKHPDIDRLARRDEVQQQLETRAAALDVIAEQILEQDAGARDAQLAKLLAEAPFADPKAAIDFMNVNGVDALKSRIEGFVTMAEATWASDGRLDLDQVESFEYLQAWAEWLFSDGSSLRGDTAQTILWMWAAREWYGGRWSTQLANFVKTYRGSVLQGLTQTEPYADWRAQLVLAVELDSKPSWYPRMDGTVVVQNRIETSGVVRWFEEQLSGSGQVGGWSVQRTLYDQAGEYVTEPPDQEVRQVDSVLFIDDKKALDLRAGDGDVQVAAWQPVLSLQLPEQRWTSGMNDKIYLTTRIGPIPCLVYSQGEAQYWYAPGYGLVRQVLEGKTLRELAYSSLVR